MSNDFLMEHYKMLNEQYYGKNPLLSKIDDAFDNIIKICREKQNQNGNIFKLMGSKEMKEIDKYKSIIENNIEELFNFKTVLIEINNIGFINAFSVSESLVPSIVWAKKEIGKYGIRYANKNRSLDIIISIEIILANNITGRILTAVLLHEIGHNFYYENNVIYYASIMNRYLSIYNIIQSNTNKEIQKELKNVQIDNKTLEEYYKNRDELINKIKGGLLINNLVATVLPTIFITTNTFKNIFNKIIKKVESYEITNYIKSFINFGITAVESVEITKNIYKGIKKSGALINSIKHPLKVLQLDTKFFLNHPLHIAQILTDKRNELFADNFATSYGYGPELSEMQAIQLNSNGFTLLDLIGKKSKIFNLMVDVLFKTMELIPDPFVDRVSEPSRIIDQIKYLEANLKNEALSDKQKKAISNDLKELYDVYDKVKDMSSLDGELIKNGKVLTALIVQRDFATKGEIGYHLNPKTYNKKGNWKNLI